MTARSQGAAIILTTNQAKVPAKEGQLADRQWETSPKERNRWPSTPVSLPLPPPTHTHTHTRVRAFTQMPRETGVNEQEAEGSHSTEGIILYTGLGWAGFRHRTH